ncbi:ABC transporter substrate-binding protein [Numidum massiliense]|uniref:ABC transporter substrate-binding protein n=1 Tax=Numidum massiliense TaxID=1522315 RepID=UPI0006D53BE2|nr:ABC transporter substrate-binding protein [Numidum massiliense]
MKRGFLLAITFLLLFSLALVGCQANDGGSAKNEEKAGGSEEKGKEKDSAKGGEGQDLLVYGRGSDSVSLDPAVVTDGESLKVTKNIYDTLVDYGEQDTTIHEALATEWDVSDDGLTYTFKLREGVKFHDGTDFNADAVVKNFDRWMNAKDKNAFAYYASQFGGFKGDKGHVIKEVKADGDYKVVIALNRPQAPFLQNIAMSPFGIISPAALEKYGDKIGENPVGTGPYAFKEWKRNETITLTKNDNYWQEGAPKLNTLIFQVIPDNSARLTALKTGEIDLMDGVNPSDVAGVEKEDGLQIILRPPMNVGYLGFNVEKKPFDDKKVRQALNHAVDKQALIDAFYAGNADPAKNPMPDVIAGYNDKIDPYPYDVEKAKKLLAEAGFKDGFEMELWAMPLPRDYMPEPQKIAEAIQADFEQVGVKAKIKTFEWATYLDKVQKGEAPAFLLGWTGDNGDADNFIYVLLDKDAIDSNNYSRYSNDKLHDLLVKAQSETDEAKRVALYEEAQEIIHEDAPWIPLVYAKPALAAKDTLKDFKPHPTGSDRFTDVYFEK